MAKSLHPCVCQTHMAYVLGNEEEGEVYVAAYRHGESGHLGWMARLKWCWSILWKGTPYESEYTFCPDDALGFAESIKQAALKAGGSETSDSDRKVAGFKAD